VAPEELESALGYLAERGVLHRDRDRWGLARYVATGGGFPADDVDLRGTIEENFTVVEEDGPASDALAEVDFDDGALYLHPGAIYPIEGVTYEVRRLDWDARKGYVRRVDAPYYTEAVCKTRIRMVDSPPSPTEESGVGYGHLVRAVPGFKKLRFRTHENIGFGPVNLPDLELHTTAAFWALPRQVVAALDDPLQRAAAALAAAHAIHHVAAMVLMCDVRDLGHAVTAGNDGAWAKVIDARRLPDAEAVLQASGVPWIHLYDNVPGGAGLSSQAHALGASFFERVIDAVRGCRCERGCPTCLGAQASLPQAATAPVDPERVLMVLHGLRSSVAR
jgi:DEAD/DEAH box helicase domain-containing protein